MHKARLRCVIVWRVHLMHGIMPSTGHAGTDRKGDKVQVKLSPCHEEVWGVGAQLHALLTSAIDGGEWLASRPGHFTPRKRASGTH
jgi:hypothetical protein